MTKLEIVIPASELDDFIELLEQLSVPGYTIFRQVAGMGDRGFQDAIGLSGAFENAYLIVACNAEVFERLREPIRVYLRSHGGFCLISEVMWLLH